MSVKENEKTLFLAVLYFAHGKDMSWWGAVAFFCFLRIIAPAFLKNQSGISLFQMDCQTYFCFVLVKEAMLDGITDLT